jgi:hypothetical protein
VQRSYSHLRRSIPAIFSLHTSGFLLAGSHVSLLRRQAMNCNASSLPPSSRNVKASLLTVPLYRAVGYNRNTGFCRLCFRLRAVLLCWSSLSFTICFGLHDHLQVCRIFYFHVHKGFCFAAFFLPLFSRGHTLHVFICEVD